MTKEKYQLLLELPPEQFESLKTDIAEARHMFATS